MKHKKFQLPSYVSKVKLLILPLLLLAIVGVGLKWHDSKKVVIKTKDQSVSQGEVTKGTNVARQSNLLQTRDTLEFESPIIQPEIKNANAAILKWDQVGAEAGVDVELRTKNGDTWSDWAESAGVDDRKDGAPVPHAALILGNDIQSVQYRFKLSGSQAAASPVVDTSATTLEMVDTTKGPEPTKPKSVVDKILSSLKLEKSVNAVADGPPIFSRAAWGAPEPTSSPRWEPEYRPLSRVIVHHTATPFNSDVGAQLRAIWHYHANSLGWGDIGYNYLVDHGGNIFQGRYYDQAEADSQKAEVVAGHAYGNNYGSTGISVLGDFTKAPPTGAAMRSVANIAAYKMHKFDVNPAADSNLIGHRDVGQTACPGNQFYPQLNNVRTMSSEYYYKYSSMFKLDSRYVNEGVDSVSTNTVTLNPGQAATAYIDVVNTGSDTWSNNTANTIYLGTDIPQDRPSALAHSSWVTYNRPASFTYKVNTNNGALTQSNTVGPGEAARFEFTIQAPYQGGNYKEHFHFLSEGRTWFLRNQGIHFNVNVPEPSYSWQPISQAAYTDATKATPVNISAIQTNQRFYVENTVKNTSNQVWRKAGPTPFRMGTSAPQNRTSSFQDSTWLTATRPALLNESVVNPGQNGTFGYWMKAPATPGQYKEYFNLLTENRRWMTDYGMHWLITVQP